MTINKLSEVIKVNDNFKNAINLYLSLNKTDKILSYIPTKSSADILKLYLESVEKNKSQSTILIGPYGKGKSHLLLVLLAIISMERNTDNNKIIEVLVDSINNVNEEVTESIKNIWGKKGRFLPVLISSTQGDLNQAFLLGLNEALKRERFTDLFPETYFTHALEVINNWAKNYSNTYNFFIKKLKEQNISYKEIVSGLNSYDKKSLDTFKKIYPELTSGSQFNPLVNSEILPLYKGISQKLSEEYGYSGIYIVFDEFSKFIESRDKTSVGNDMKLLQDICELAQESDQSQIFITFVAHKSIKEYGKYLSSDIINSFTGIEGRIEERYFITSSKNNYELIKNAIYKDINNIRNDPNCRKYLNNTIVNKFYQIPAFRTMFKENDFQNIIVNGCYPLNPISSYLLLNASEKVAQNERTLFTFISKDEPSSMARYIKNHNNKMQWIITPDLIYDYFKGLFKKDVVNEYIHREWLKAEYAISKATNLEQSKILKVMALINIVNKPDELSANERHLALAAGIDNAREVLDKLVNNQIIYKKNSNDQYVFKTRIGTDLKNEIKRRRTLKEANKINIGKVLFEISNTKFIMPKVYNQEFAMTRYFQIEYINLDYFFSINDSSSFFDKENFCDGKVIALICTNEEQINNVESILRKLNELASEKLVILNPCKSFEMIEKIQDYEVIQELKNDALFIENNRVLRNELGIFEEDITNDLLTYITKAYELQNGCKAFYYKNGKSMEWDRNNLNKLIDHICLTYYSKTPVINNELINRQFITTSPIKKARKAIINYLLEKNIDESFYTGTNPEATIYRSLFKNTGILDGKASESMKAFLSQIDSSISLCNDNKISLNSIVQAVTCAPFGIRKGVLPIYLAHVLSNRNEDIIVYFDTKEVQLTSDIILNMCDNPDDYYLFMSAQSVEKEMYIVGLIKLFDIESKYNLSTSRLNNIIIGMQRWFRALPQVTKNFRNQSDIFKDQNIYSAMLVIKPLLQKVDANPYEIIFNKIPTGFNCYDDYEHCLKCIVELKDILDNYLDWLIKKTVKETITIFKSKDDLYHTLKNWYDKQSSMSKKGIYSNRITNLMNFIPSMAIYDDAEIMKKVIKAVTDVYIENWNDNSFEEYLTVLKDVKKEIESIKNEINTDKQELIFKNKEGKTIQKYYNKIDENTGTILRNIIEDNIDDFSDLSVNDKVAILVEMLEKVLS